MKNFNLFENLNPYPPPYLKDFTAEPITFNYLWNIIKYEYPNDRQFFYYWELIFNSLLYGYVLGALLFFIWRFFNNKHH